MYFAARLQMMNGSLENFFFRKYFLFVCYQESLSVLLCYLTNKEKLELKWNPLKGITINGLNLLMGSIFLRSPRPVWN
jgi:hypothetical protein